MNAQIPQHDAARDAWLANLGKVEVIEGTPWQALDHTTQVRRILKIPPVGPDGTRAKDYRYAIEVRQDGAVRCSAWSQPFADEGEAVSFGNMALADFIKLSQAALHGTASQNQNRMDPELADPEGWIDRDRHVLRAQFPAFTTRLFGTDLSGHFLDHPHVRHVRLGVGMEALYVRLCDGTPLRCQSKRIELQGPHNTDNINFIVDTARALGWKNVQVTGSQDFTVVMTRALKEAGISVAAPTLTDPFPQPLYPGPAYGRAAPLRPQPVP